MYKKYCECFSNNINDEKIYVTFSCTKSNCNKKYCECYKLGEKCNINCRCVNCLNNGEEKNNKKKLFLNIQWKELVY